jgi:hypothetical protein
MSTQAGVARWGDGFRLCRWNSLAGPALVVMSTPPLTAGKDAR